MSVVEKPVLRTQKSHVAGACIAAWIAFLGVGMGSAGHANASPNAQPQVIGGEPANPGTFPWLAFVAAEFAGGEGGVCTGSVVSSNLILTAAHCVVDRESGATRNPANYVVVTGNVNWTGAPREASAVDQILVYTSYKSSGALAGLGDAALLHLSSPIHAPPVRVAANKFWDKGTAALIAGWGATEFEQKDITAHLQWAFTVVQSDQYCFGSAPGFLPGAQLCAVEAASFKSGACYGDSGGPLLAQAPGREELVLIGVLRGGYGDCRTDMPNVFTRSDLIASWVSGQIKALAPPPPVPTPQTPVSTASIDAGRVEPLVLGRSQALALVRTALRQSFTRHFLKRRHYEIRCGRPSWYPQNRQRCEVSWVLGRRNYRGSVILSARLADGTPKVRATATIRRKSELCADGRYRGKIWCRVQTWKGMVEVPMNRPQ